MKKQTKSQEEFIWPEFKTDRERIKFYSQKYKNRSLSEAFNDVYGTKLRTDVLEETCIGEVKLRQTIKALIKSITKNNVVFDAQSVKEPLTCRVNLYKYEKFRKFLPLEPIELKVIEKSNRGVIVDPLVPIFDNWLQPILKDPTIQQDITTPKLVVVEDLKLVSGGFIGKVMVEDLTNFIGEPQYIDAFIPGSQIVLNIEKDFEKWIGKTVPAFITNYIQKPGIGSGMSLICSTKNYLKYLGDLQKIELFKVWSEDGPVWDAVQKLELEGTVTGVINSSKKCGVFVELKAHNITGIVPLKPEELVNYKPGQPINVNIIGFEEEMVWNPKVQQLQHAIPYVIENNILKECNLKPILKLA